MEIESNMDMKRIIKLVLAGSHREFRRWCHDEHKMSPQVASNNGMYYARDHSSFRGVGRLGVDYELVLIGTWEENKAYRDDWIQVLLNEHFGKIKHGKRMSPVDESYSIDFTKKDPSWILDNDPIMKGILNVEKEEGESESAFNFMEALRAL